MKRLAPGKYSAYYALWVVHYSGKELVGISYYFHWLGGVQHVKVLPL